jgi:hypothetical protein
MDMSQLQQTVCWRMHPSKSLSDWRLQIFNRSTKTFETYHVHRVVLAVGPRACDFFREAFESKQQQQQRSTSTITTNTNTNTVTRIPLIAQACPLVPLFLDFVYCQPTFDIHTDTAVGLAYLAEYFRQPKLLHRIYVYIGKDLRGETLHKYFLYSVYYDQHAILDLVLQVCAKALPTMDSSNADVSAFLFDLAPEYFMILLDSIQERQQEGESHTNNNYANLSKLVADYCVLHQQELTLAVFEQLTICLTSHHYHTIKTKTAMTLLQLELVLQEEEEEERRQDDELPNILPSDLQKKCILVLSEDWESLCDMEMEPHTVTQLLQRISRNKSQDDSSDSAPLLVELFQATLTRAHYQLQKTREDWTASLERESFLRKDLNQVVDERNQVQKELQSLHKLFGTAKTEMKEQIQGWIRKHDNENGSTKVAGRTSQLGRGTVASQEGIGTTQELQSSNRHTRICGYELFGHFGGFLV